MTGVIVYAMTLAVTNPATGEVVDRVPDMSVDDIAAAVERVHTASPAWRATPADRRADVLRDAARLIRDRQDDLARTVTLESGKPIAEARGEVGTAATFLEWNAEEGRRTYGRTIPSPLPGRRYLTMVQPVGVVAAITPWNFPALMVTRKVGAALAAGCTVVLRPAPSTPLIARAIHEILREAGLPDHVLELVTNADSPAAGELLATHPLVRKITFTGSTAVGARLCELAARGMKRVSMELGGHAPFVVFPDADVEAVAESVIASRYRNGGQSCISTNRLFLHRDIAGQVLADLTERVKALEVGDGMRPETRIGPLIDEAALRRLESLQADAVERGAHTVVGGERAHPAGLSGPFYQPTMVTRVPKDARLLREETFGPLLSVTEFETEDEVVEYANSTRYGLAAYVFTRDLNTAMRMTDRLDFGVVGVNDPAPSAACLPFGGVKMSGIGRECGSEGVLAFTETKAVSIAEG